MSSEDLSVKSLCLSENRGYKRQSPKKTMVVVNLEMEKENRQTPKSITSNVERVRFKDVLVENSPNEVVPKLTVYDKINQPVNLQVNNELIKPKASPKVYNYKAIYENKKAELQRKQAEDERKKREFHSRPVPNFAECHKKQTKIVQHIVTIPETPVTLKRSQAALQKRQQKIKETKPVVSKSTTCLNVKPFNLCCELRVQQRRLYDIEVARTTELKKKQEEAERKEREKMEIKQIRKWAQFKARPNPFK